jgi:hypothetical protein
MRVTLLVVEVEVEVEVEVKGGWRWRVGGVLGVGFKFKAGWSHRAHDCGRKKGGEWREKGGQHERQYAVGNKRGKWLETQKGCPQAQPRKAEQKTANKSSHKAPELP